MKKIVLREGHPPIENLVAVIRIDIAHQFNPKNWSDMAPNEMPYRIGHTPKDLLDDANEHSALLAYGEADLYEFLDSPNSVVQLVIIDPETNEIWSDEIEAGDEGYWVPREEQRPGIDDVDGV